MKYVRLLNGIRVVAFISAGVFAVIGATRQHPGKGIRGWPAHAFVLCWGIALLSIVAGIMAEGKIKMRHRDPLNRGNDPVKFWILVGIFFVAGTVTSIIGVVKLITDISIAS
jgi:hypothetical protein